MRAENTMLANYNKTRCNSLINRSASGMAERLETIGRKIGLKFNSAPVHGCYYLSTEMFYVEINIDASSGAVNEAKIHHIDATQANAQPSAQVFRSQWLCDRVFKVFEFP